MWYGVVAAMAAAVGTAVVTAVVVKWWITHQSGVTIASRNPASAPTTVVAALRAPRVVGLARSGSITLALPQPRCGASDLRPSAVHPRRVRATSNFLAVPVPTNERFVLFVCLFFVLPVPPKFWNGSRFVRPWKSEIGNRKKRRVA